MKSSFFFVVVLSLSSIFISSLIATFSKDDMAMLGGVRDVPANENSVEVESLARFAVDEHNKKENALLEFARVVKAKEQVVAGTMHHLTLEIIEAGKKKLYEAKVWVKPWLNFKELQEFKPASDDGAPSTTITPSDLGCKKGEMHLDGGKFQEMIQKCSTLLIMLSRLYSRGLTLCFLMNSKRLFMPTLRSVGRLQSTTWF
ncbi:cysteine proteinase inhibitor 6-like [Brassica napus]|uniref:cysteine proteinase inhibitor 6-like n=1 Tax=Brassica napus TaxID=3708 RepID=UPI002078E7E0|nr:cysteine proteinase inhibitor 6-like [Brassica napus]